MLYSHIEHAQTEVPSLLLIGMATGRHKGLAPPIVVNIVSTTVN